MDRDTGPGLGDRSLGQELGTGLGVELVPRFFVATHQVDNGRATLEGADAAHLARSLRARPGDTVVVVEAGRIEHGVILDEVAVERVSGRVAWSRPVTGEPSLQVLVLQALPSQGMEAAIEALTEAGAAAIWPVLTSRTVPRLDPGRIQARLARWRSVAREAAQLAGRALPPEVRTPAPLVDAVRALPGCSMLTCVPDAAAVPIGAVTLDAARPAAVVIGPEGGLDPSELRALEDAGAVAVHLGPRTLPSRLAGVVATLLLLARAGDLDAGVERPPR